MAVRYVAMVMLGLAALSAHAVRCISESAPATAALVELYSSKSCSSCPAAELWLASLGERYARSSVMPLTLFVDYWPYNGSNNPYTKRKLSQLQRLALVYTPQVVVQGREFPAWGTKAFDEAIVRIMSQPAKARMSLAVLDVMGRTLEAEASAELVVPVDDAVLYMAAYHDYVVLEWQGPFPIPGRLVERRALALLPGAERANSGVAAFVQDRRTGEVLQALLRSTC
jgi:hypothetical protein